MKRVRAFFALALTVALAPIGTRADDATAVIARVDAGLVSGVAQDGVVAYKGIPYAVPPVGALRWRPPIPARPWSGALQATDYGASCPQAQAPDRIVEGSRALTMSEDCLTLNVWTPVARAKPLPVMVWLHGGGNDGGTGSQTYYDGATFARDGVVLVTINYRLGALGFFAHPALTGIVSDGVETGNFGLLDQLAALRWTQRNIAAFGGDPANVTVFGESAGGEDAVALASSDAANGLFQRAIAESAADLWTNWLDMPSARERGAAIATSLGLPGARATEQQLRAVPVDALMHLRYDQLIGPMVDRGIVPRRPADGISPRVPFIIGTNDGDNSFANDLTDPATVFPRLPSAQLAAVLALYRMKGYPANLDAPRIFGDGEFAAPARWVAGRIVADGQAAYVYRFDYVLSALTFGRKNAHHGSEIPFVFENYPPVSVSDTDRAIGSALHDCWIAFARTGTPVCSGAPGWTPYDARNGRVMVFDSVPSVRDPGNSDVLTLLENGLLHH